MVAKVSAVKEEKAAANRALYEALKVCANVLNQLAGSEQPDPLVCFLAVERAHGALEKAERLTGVKRSAKI